MNYLAHFHLAADDEALIIGALLGDFVKGPLRGDYPGGWERGIQLHRRVDAWTDSHSQVAALLQQLPASYRRYGGIMLDVCFDHCLSRRWQDFYHRPLPDFATEIYDTLAAQQQYFPIDARRQAQRLTQYDVLNAMGDWQTIDNMLKGIGRRLRRENPLAGSAVVLKEMLPDIDAVFTILYPELMHFGTRSLQES